MSRSGYTDDLDHLAYGRWRAQLKSAIRGRRGQAFLRELAAAMDAMPKKRLIADELVNEDGECCTLGVVCRSRGLDAKNIDYEDPHSVAMLMGIAYQLVAEIEYENDECDYRFVEEPIIGPPRYPHCPRTRSVRVVETPEERWQRMRRWVENHIKVHEAEKQEKS